MISISSGAFCGGNDFRFLRTDEARNLGELQGMIQVKK